MSLQSYQLVDRDQLALDISDIHKQSLANTSIDDFKHLSKMERWGKVCTLLGYATAWIVPNPISALLISQGSFTRWTQVGHPISHRAYNKIAGEQVNYTSKKFAQGWRRFLDWPDFDVFGGGIFSGVLGIGSLADCNIGTCSGGDYGDGDHGEGAESGRTFGDGVPRNEDGAGGYGDGASLYCIRRKALPRSLTVVDNRHRTSC